MLCSGGNWLMWRQLLCWALLLAAAGDSKSQRWPFHKEAVAGSWGLHAMAGVIFSVAPVYLTVKMVLSECEKGPGGKCLESTQMWF